MLRGPQTPGELKTRTERLHPLGSTEAVEEALAPLVGRELVERLPRRPGQKEERYAQRLSVDAEPEIELQDEPGSLEERVRRLEEEVARLGRAIEAS
jgi:uncharacterized protein YceH (UPF0502 family)